MDPLTLAGRQDGEEVRALLLLDGSEGVGLVGLGRLVERFGSAVATLRAPVRACREVCRGYRPPSTEARRAVDRALAEAHRLGMGVVTWNDRAYPRRLSNLHDPPPVLFLRGRAELLARQAITVVGARRATARARDVSERLGHALACAGACVGSGLALGVDGAAHRGALDAGGETVAVLGTGADRAYPPSHGRLFRDIVRDGLVVTEFAPGTPPLPHHFPRRNRILAALSRAVVVVEAGERSGALITVDHALDLGVDVWAVPGPIDLKGCIGSNRLLADGARPLVSVASFVEQVCGETDPEEAGPAGSAGRAGPAGPAGVVLSALQNEALGVDELARRLDLSASKVLTLLTELELSGAVRRLPGMRFGVAA